MPWGWAVMLKSRSGMDVVSSRWKSIICLGATSVLVSEAFKLKNFEIWLPATYNNGLVVKYWPF